MGIRGVIFLSHADVDKGSVEPVRVLLDAANVFYDILSIQPGEETIKAMRRGISDAAVFVLFYSPKTETVWIRFEQELSQIQLIKHVSLRVLVCPLGKANYRSLPDWLQRFMTTPIEFTASDIVRTIQYLHHESISIAHPEIISSCPGRESLLRQISLDIMTGPTKHGTPINAIVLSGIQGMGRSTLASQVIAEAFKGMRPAGPVFDLPMAAGPVDWHLRFIEDLKGSLTNKEKASQRDMFSRADPKEQASFLIASLGHWADVNQVVTIKTRWGLRDRGDRLHLWLEELIKALQMRSAVKLIMLSERRLPAVEVTLYPNVRQYYLEELDQQTIEYILSKSIDKRYLNVNRLPSIATRVQGHPATANYVSYLVNGGRSIDSLDLSPEPIYVFQSKILNSLFENGMLSEIQRRILKLLSWFPLLSSSLIARTFDDVQEIDLVSALWELNEFSLVDQAELGRYKVPAIVSSSYRRMTVEHDSKTFERVASLLRESFDKDVIDVDLIESLLVGVVAYTGLIPDEFMGVLTAANLLQLIEKEYFAGLDARDNQAPMRWNAAYKIAQMASRFDSSDDTFESIMFYGADGYIRANGNPHDLITLLRRKGFISADYLEGSYLYHVEKDYERAATCLKRTLGGKNFKVRNVRLLTRIYLRVGNPEMALDALDKVTESRLLRDTGLLVMKIRALRMARLRPEADALAARLSDVDNEYGDLSLYKASQAFSAGQYDKVKEHIEAARLAPRSNKLTISFLGCASDVEQGVNDDLPGTCALARAGGRESDALQLEARAALFVGDWRTAERTLSKIARKDYFDTSVELRMLECKVLDKEIAADPVMLATVRNRREECLRKVATGAAGYRI